MRGDNKNVRVPLLERLSRFHSRIVLPLWIRDRAIVDQDVDAPVEKLCGLLHLLSDLVRVPEIAYSCAKGARVGIRLQMRVREVLELFFVNVKDENAVPALEEAADDTAPDALSGSGDECSLDHVFAPEK